MIQATTILFSIALKKSFVPDHPNDRPGEVRVVDTRMPSQGETKSVAAPPVPRRSLASVYA
jgi:hypothetical protein